MLVLQQLSCLLECLADPPAIRIDDGKEGLDRFLLGFDVELDITAGAPAAPVPALEPAQRQPGHSAVPVWPPHGCGSQPAPLPTWSTRQPGAAWKPASARRLPIMRPAPEPLGAMASGPRRNSAR